MIKRRTIVLYSVDMHVARARWPSSNGKTYESIYLCASFCQDRKSHNNAIASYSPIELALRHKGDLSALASLDGVELHESASIGAVWIAAEIAPRLGIQRARC